MAAALRGHRGHQQNAHRSQVGMRAGRIAKGVSEAKSHEATPTGDKTREAAAMEIAQHLGAFAAVVIASGAQHGHLRRASSGGAGTHTKGEGAAVEPSTRTPILTHHGQVEGIVIGGQRG